MRLVQLKVFFTEFPNRVRIVAATESNLKRLFVSLITVGHGKHSHSHKRENVPQENKWQQQKQQVGQDQWILEFHKSRDEIKGKIKAL